MTQMHGRSAAALFVLLVLLATGACGDGEEGVQVSLRAGDEANRVSPNPSEKLRVGIGCMISASATADLYGRLVDELGHQVGKSAITVQRNSYGEINDLLEQRRLDCALVCTGAYLAGRKRFGMLALVVPVFHGSPTYHSVIITRADSGIKDFGGLKGRKFAFVDPLSNTGRAYPVWRILRLNSTPEEYFTYQYTGTHDNSIQSVKAGLTDGAAVDELIFDHLRAWDPDAIEGLQIIERSPPFGAPPVVIHPDVSNTERARMMQAFLALRGTSEGESILTALGVDRFMTPPAGLYDSAAEQHGVIERYDRRKVNK